MKKINLLIFALLLSSMVKLNAGSTIPVSLNAEDWYEDGFSLGIITSNDDDELVFELPVDAEGEPWQAMGIPLISIDLDTYPVLRIKIKGTEGVAWSLKASDLVVLDPQFSIVGDGDRTSFGTFDFNVVESTEFSGIKNFNLFVWIIGKGNQLNIEELFFFNPLDPPGNTASYSGEKTHSIAFTSRDGGITLGNVQGKAITVFSVDGKLIQQTFATESHLDIDLVKGIYLIKAGETILKVAI